MFYIVFELHRIIHISATRCPIEMGFGSKCCIFNGQVIYIEKSKLNIADMWLIPLDHVTYVWYHPHVIFDSFSNIIPQKIMHFLQPVISKTIGIGNFKGRFLKSGLQRNHLWPYKQMVISQKVGVWTWFL